MEDVNEQLEVCRVFLCQPGTVVIHTDTLEDVECEALEVMRECEPPVDSAGDRVHGVVAHKNVESSWFIDEDVVEMR